VSQTKDGSNEGQTWTAYLKLRGQLCQLDRRKLIDEFEEFASSLRHRDVRYRIIVVVEGEFPQARNFVHHVRVNGPDSSGEVAGA
jgi:hypothetical protein